MEVATTGFGLWFKHMLGDNATVSQHGAESVYTHTYEPGDLHSLSLTVQKGIQPWSPGAPTAQPFTFHGTKILDWEFSISNEGFLQLSLGLDTEDVDRTTGLAVASYGDLENLSFKEGQLTVGSAGGVTTTIAAGVTDVTMQGTNALATDRFFLGSQGLKEKQLENGYRELSGTFSAEFRSINDFYAAFEADTEKQLVLTFEGSEIGVTTTFTQQLQITYHDVRFEGETPKVSGPEPSVISVPYTGWETTAGDSITVSYRTTDSTS
jgi:hypothetical protein